ncbi:MAG: hypothetical protein Q4D59_11235, partial [Erysipelotrichaceae bacterium]|nr:hypothetical protein [Erysipelotrichaceae bacterium]
MKQHLQKLAAAGICTLAMASVTAPVCAEGYTPVSGTETTFDKYLILDADANVPAAEFSFAISPGTAIAASETAMEVLAGPSAPTIASTAVFSPQDTAYSTVQAGDILTLADGEKYAVKVLTADFSAVQ